MPVDPRAALGFAGDVAPYELGRPGYAPEAVAHLAAALSLTPASTVVDLAAGTCKLTRLLTPLAGDVAAVEPSPAMLAALARLVPAARAIAGTHGGDPAARGLRRLAGVPRRPRPLRAARARDLRPRRRAHAGPVHRPGRVLELDRDTA